MWRVGLVAWALLAAATLACGYQEDPKTSNDSHSSGVNNRERLLATCPAKAPDFFAWQQALAEKRGLNRPVWEDDDVLDPTARVAQDYLDTLPADQRGGSGSIAVTRDADRVLATLRTKVPHPDAVAVETVRWSSKHLAAFANRIEKIEGANINGIGSGNPNGRVEVYVTRDVEKAHQRIAAVVDPCAFKVIRSAPMSPS
jgi:hypothetical protein